MDLFNIKNYREIVRLSLQKKGSRGQMGALAEGISMHPTQLSQVLSGSKDFNLEQAYAIAEYLQFADVEAKYFLLLVEKERAGTHALKKYFDKEIEKIKRESLQMSQRLKEHRNLNEHEKSLFYSSWTYSAIRLYCSLGDGKTLEEIAEYFDVDRKKIFEIMEFLVSAGLCEIKKEKYVMGTQHTHVAANSPHAIKHHINWRLKALQHQESVKEDELSFTGPMSISEKDFGVVREKLAAVIKDCAEVIKHSEAEQLACFTIDFFRF